MKIKDTILLITKQILLSIVNPILNKKILIIEDALLKKFSFFFKMSDLLNINFENKVFTISNLSVFDYSSIKDNLKCEYSWLNFIFLITNNSNSLLKIIDFYNRSKNKGFFDIYIIFTPKINLSSTHFIDNYKERFFKQHFNLSLELIPIENDIVLIDDDEYFKAISTENDQFKEGYISKMSILFQFFHKIYSDFKVKYAKGNIAYKILQKIIQYEKEKETEYLINDKNNVLFIFERNIDSLTGVLSQITYRGCMDDFYDVDVNGNLSIEDDSGNLYNLTNNTSTSTRLTKVNIFKNKEFFNLIEDYNISEAIDIVKNNFNKEIEYFNSLNKKFKLNENKIDNNHKDFGLKIECESILNKVKSIFRKEEHEHEKHINNLLHSENLDKISEGINVYNDKKNNLEYMKIYIDITYSLLKRCSNNEEYIEYETKLLSEKYENIKQVSKNINEFYEDQVIFNNNKNAFKLICLYSIVTNISIEELLNTFNIYLCLNNKLLIDKLKKFNIINPFRKSFHKISKKYILFNSKFNKNDLHYYYNGYVPIITKLIKSAFKYGWKEYKMVNDLNGETFIPDNEKIIINSSNDIVVIYVIGGLTISEIYSIRCLFKKEYAKQNKQYVILTKIINSNSIINEFI